MAESVGNAISIFLGPNGTIFAVISATLLVLLTAVLAWIIGRSKNKGNTVLLVGLSDAGKTLIFIRLIFNKFLPTHTSIKENKANYKVEQAEDAKFLELIDIPGNEKLRGKFLDQFKSLARGIIFVVDSVTFTRELHAVAECLFDILSNKMFNKLSVKILIACNKQDLTTAKSMNVVKSQLAKEINTLRKTRAAAVKGLDEQSVAHDEVFVGQKGKDFDFADLRGMKVEFIECNAKEDDKSGLKDILEWMKKLM
ncbi:signal recognition particle receptor subunit beta-like [Dendronephthya gigantea]|uniref:signal recognition particle receptor subunit beta-like n=1 Tax=Dendronephthya gigantea TaxID=151771 RepID=UPI00106C1F83|nr:signal recognition particle receptor subunit beta-like [Dendronephthya gigantea]